MLRSVSISIATVLLLTCPVITWADEPETPQRPRVGLVLAGGGAKGIAHVGVIKVLNEMRIPIDFVAGTSMGALVGGLYASGMPSDQLEELILGMDWDDLFNDNPARKDLSFQRKKDSSKFLIKLPVGFRKGKFTTPKGLIAGQKINLFIKSMVFPASHVQNFNELPIPFRAVATNIENGEAVVLSSGDLGVALRASMSIPGVFSPVEIDGRLLVDGGIALNLPMDVAREMGADVLIVVDLTIPFKKKKDLNSALEIMGQSDAFLITRNVQRQLATLTDSDVRIHPIMGDITTSDFKQGNEAIPIGEKAAREMSGELAKYALSEVEYAKYLSKRRVLPSEAPVIDFIRVVTDSKVSSTVIESRLNIRVGEPLDVHKLNKNLDIIYGLSLYDAVTYDLVTEDGRTGLVVDARARSWGPGYFAFGLNLRGSMDGINSFNMGLRYTRTELNSLAGEWQTDLELGDEFRFGTGLHLPLERSLKLFVAPSVHLQKSNVYSFDTDGKKVSQYRHTETDVTLAVGSEIASWGEFRLGVIRGAGDMNRLVGTVPPPVADYERGDLFFKLSLDTIDNVNFPHHGSYGSADVVLSMEGLGADASYERYSIDWLGADTWGKHTFLLNLQGGVTADEDAPLYDQFPLGGFVHLSGYGSDELNGQNYGLARLIYYYRLAGGLGSLMAGTPLYLGASLEAGNVWDDIDNADLQSLLHAGSVFFGADTLIGPLYLGVGHGEGGRTSLYFFLGRTF